MKKLFLISTAVLALTVAQGQTTFQKTYGGSSIGVSVQQTNDGGYIVLSGYYGYINLQKTDSYGATIWAKTYEAQLTSDIVGAVQQTKDGGYIVVGTVDLGSWYVYLLKTDSNGDTLWTKALCPSAEGAFVQQTSDGGYIVTGYIAGAQADVFLIKTDSNGNSLWAKTYGGAGMDQGWYVQQTTDGGYAVVARIQTGPSNKFCLIKTDSNGDTLWTKSYSDTIAPDWGCWFGKQTADGGYILTGGRVWVPGGGVDISLVKTDQTGNLQWSKSYGGTGNDQGYSVAQASDGGFIITGETSSFGTLSAYLIKTDINGNMLASKLYGKSGVGSYGGFVNQTSDGGCVIAGGYYGIYLIKTDSDGNSGCGETTPAFIQTNPPTIQTQPLINVTAPAIQTLSAAGAVTNFLIADSTLCSTAAVEENAVNDFKFMIYPNPFSSSTTLQSDNLFHNATLTVYNSFGQEVKQFVIRNSSSFVISRDNLASGLYFYKVTEGKGQGAGEIIATGKLVITDK